MTSRHERMVRVAAGAALVMLGAAGPSGHPPSGRPATLTSATLTTDPTPYVDMCDASAAIAIGPDTFMVANDEDNILRAYKIGEPSPIARLPLPFLKAKREADLEGVTRLGDVVYWIGSHARNKGGEKRSDRQTLFGTRISTAGGTITVTPEGKPYKKLLDRFIEPLLESRGFTDAASKAPESGDALNIEGLAASGTSLLIGFRNPLPQGKALVAELTNPTALLANGSAKPQLGKVFELDLGGLGIRSLEWISEDLGFLIVAGPAITEGEFVVYRWRDTTQSPIRVDGSTFDNFGAETLFAPPSSTTVYALSDDGDQPSPTGGLCKDAPAEQRHFRLAKLTFD